MGGDSSKPIGEFIPSPSGYRRFKNVQQSPSTTSSSSSSAVQPVEKPIPTQHINSSRTAVNRNVETGKPISEGTSATQSNDSYHQDSTGNGHHVDLTTSMYIVPTTATPSATNESAKSLTSPSKKLGLWNVGNTCYTNSVLQVLYENQVFRECCEGESGLAEQDGLLSSLSQLFSQINGAKKSRRTAIFRSPDHHDAHEFYSYLMNAIGEELLQRKEQSLSLVHHPSSPNLYNIQSPLNRELATSSNRWIIRRASGDEASAQAQSPASTQTTPSPQRAKHLQSPATPQVTTWLHELFQGYLVYETRCLCCENVTRRREPFLDVPLDIEDDNANLLTCIRNFARTEILRGKDKYFCDLCGCLQEAERCLRFERLPRILAIHLKRFKFDEIRGCYSRVSSRVEFPSTLFFPADALARDHPFITFSTDSSFDGGSNCYVMSQTQSRQSQEGIRSDSAVIDQNTNVSSDRQAVGVVRRGRSSRHHHSKLCGPEFDLTGVVVHIGMSMSHGHYVSCVKSDDSWWLYDDHNVKQVSPNTLSLFFGSSDKNSGAKCGYLLFYTSRTPFPFKRRTCPSGPRWPSHLLQSLTFKQRMEDHDSPRTTDNKVIDSQTETHYYI